MANDDENYEFENVPAETPLSPEEAVIRRHRREKKDLQGKILSMKKLVSKSDKKKKKDLSEEILKLETELEKRHHLELEAFGHVDVHPEEKLVPALNRLSISSSDDHDHSLNPNILLEDDATPVNSSPGTPKISRAQKRRQKKSTQEKERQKRIDLETDALVEISDWKKEDTEIKAVLENFQLEVFDIPSDGHCLYSAVSHQLKINEADPFNVESLRMQTAKYLLHHKDDYIAFFDENISASEENFHRYCKEIQDTAAWGGQVEVQVMSKILERPIRIIQANGPPLIFGEEFKLPMLTLTYHRHKILSGEHYNSVICKTGGDDETGA